MQHIKDMESLLSISGCSPVIDSWLVCLILINIVWIAAVAGTGAAGSVVAR